MAFFDIQHNKAVNPNSGLPSASLVLQSSKLETNLGTVWGEKLRTGAQVPVCPNNSFCVDHTHILSLSVEG